MKAVDARFAGRLLLTLGAIVAVAAIVKLADVLVLIFGAILVAVLLDGIAGALTRRAPLPRTAGVAIAVALVVAVVAALSVGAGAQTEAQLALLSELLPKAWSGLEAQLSGSPFGASILAAIGRLQGPGDLVVKWAPRLASQAAAAAAASLIVGFAGLYLAFNPGSYLRGALLLAPAAARAGVERVVRACHVALRQWLLGQMFSMVLVGVTTGVGLWLAGVPSPLALGLIAGLAQFVPVVGPFVAAGPGLLLGMALGPETLFWAAVVYVGAAQLEANVITPLMLRRMTQLPMAVTLFAVLAMGVLLGPLGVLFATPLAVVAYEVVKVGYVEGVLGERLAAADDQAPPGG